MGFWNHPFQINADGRIFSALLAATLLALAYIGTRALPKHWRLPLTIPAGVSLALALASCTPASESLFSSLTSSALGAMFRESQRFLPPLLLWVTVASAVGAMKICDRIRSGTRRAGRRPASTSAAGIAGAVAAAPLVIALILAVPPAWGLKGQLRARQLPTEWAEARAVIQDSPGTVLALPWFAYYTSKIAGHRLVQNPIPSYFDGEVISNSDPRFSMIPSRENADPRETAAQTIVENLRSGSAQGAALAKLGVRWVAVAHDVDWESYSGLRVDPDLQVVVDGPTLTLYEVAGVGNGTISESGTVDVAQPHLLPFWSASTPESITMPVPYQFGWLRGLSPGTIGPDGRLTLPAGDGPIWFWPALVVIGADLLWAAAVVLALRKRGRSRHFPAP
jgi:hypothetical protein